MEMGQMKLRHAKETDVKSIIELQAQLDRPLSKDRYETKKFRKLVKPNRINICIINWY